MFPIKRGAGINAAEQELACSPTRYSSTYGPIQTCSSNANDADKGGGKELCDLLAVCGDDILIFSVKDIAWPKVDDPQVAWLRWYRSGAGVRRSNRRGRAYAHEQRGMDLSRRGVSAKERDAKERVIAEGMRNANHGGKYLQLQFTVEDKGVFTRPWTATMTYGFGLADWMEQACAENIQWYSGQDAEVPRAAKPGF
jgi:hypothetical protein